jgi:hypothetical protein
MQSPAPLGYWLLATSWYNTFQANKVVCTDRSASLPYRTTYLPPTWPNVPASWWWCHKGQISTDHNITPIYVRWYMHAIPRWLQQDSLISFGDSCPDFIMYFTMFIVVFFSYCVFTCLCMCISHQPVDRLFKTIQGSVSHQVLCVHVSLSMQSFHGLMV